MSRRHFLLLALVFGPPLGFWAWLCAHATASDRSELLGHVLSGTISLPALVSLLTIPPPETRVLRPAPIADVAAPATPGGEAGRHALLTRLLRGGPGSDGDLLLARGLTNRTLLFLGGPREAALVEHACSMAGGRAVAIDALRAPGRICADGSLTYAANDDGGSTATAAAHNRTLLLRPHPSARPQICWVPRLQLTLLSLTVFGSAVDDAELSLEMVRSLASGTYDGSAGGRGGRRRGWRRRRHGLGFSGALTTPTSAGEPGEHLLTSARLRNYLPPLLWEARAARAAGGGRLLGPATHLARRRGSARWKRGAKGKGGGRGGRLRRSMCQPWWEWEGRRMLGRGGLGEAWREWERLDVVYLATDGADIDALFVAENDEHAERRSDEAAGKRTRRSAGGGGGGGGGAQLSRLLARVRGGAAAGGEAKWRGGAGAGGTDAYRRQVSRLLTDVATLTTTVGAAGLGAIEQPHIAWVVSGRLAAERRPAWPSLEVAAKVHETMTAEARAALQLAADDELDPSSSSSSSPPPPSPRLAMLRLRADVGTDEYLHHAFAAVPGPR